MHREILEVFVDAADTVLRTEAGVHIFSGDPEQKRSHYLSNDVTVLISLVGDVSGQAIYGMKVATAQAFISRILGQDIDEFDELAQSGIGELANVIAGQAGSRLAHLGLRMDISIPMLLLGAGSHITTLNIDRLSIPLETGLGTIGFDLAIRMLPVQDDQNGWKPASYVMLDKLQ